MRAELPAVEWFSHSRAPVTHRRVGRFFAGSGGFQMTFGLEKSDTIWQRRKLGPVKQKLVYPVYEKQIHNNYQSIIKHTLNMLSKNDPRWCIVEIVLILFITHRY